MLVITVSVSGYWYPEAGQDLVPSHHNPPKTVPHKPSPSSHTLSCSP